MSNRSVSVVVPVYGDWDSLSQCIESLKHSISSKHKIILVNDCGPDVELMEQNIQQAIKGLPNFEYHRNEQNLGFIKTCNRAVFELDKSGNDVLLLNSDTMVTEGFLEELTEVLYLSDTHGCTGPRSNNATIASVPFRLRNNQPERELKYSYDIYKQVKPLLPRFIVTPVIVGFCMLIRRELIDKFGLFDEVYGRGYSEENDFCLRLGAAGYLSVMCNQAYVYHLESRSFTSEEKARLIRENEAKMLTRYPYYFDRVNHYIDYEIDAVDWFADVLFGPTEPPKILIDLSDLSEVPDNVYKLLTNLATHKQSTECVILSSGEIAGLEKYGFRVLNSAPNELFHAGFNPSDTTGVESQTRLNRCCLKILSPAKVKEQSTEILAAANAQGVDIPALKNRWQYFNNIAESQAKDKAIPVTTKLKKLIVKNPTAYKIARKVYKKFKG